MAIGWVVPDLLTQLDTEFTGLQVEGFSGNSLFDTSDGRYGKLKQFASQFTMCQIGK